VIVVKWMPHPQYENDGAFERFYYARGAGWAAWTEYKNRSATPHNTSIFATAGGPNTQPRTFGCHGVPPSS
jgi:hypothetical protein